MPALRMQTRGDMTATTMRSYRSRLARLGC
jgi:hypothetical protein